MGALIISADWDEEAGVWVATSDDILGLVTEAETLEALRTKLADIVPELIDANGLAEGADAASPVEIVARQRLAFARLDGRFRTGASPSTSRGGLLLQAPSDGRSGVLA